MFVKFTNKKFKLDTYYSSFGFEYGQLYEFIEIDKVKRRIKVSADNISGLVHQGYAYIKYGDGTILNIKNQII